MEELIRARLLATVAGVPADWGSSPQAATLPRLVLMRVSGPGQYSMTGPIAYRKARIQIDCFAGSPGAAKLIARQVIDALSGWKAGAILGAFLDNERDFPPDPEGATSVARVALEFFIHHQEA